MQPCLLSSLQWGLQLDEEGELQINLTGVATALQQQQQESGEAGMEQDWREPSVFPMEVERQGECSQRPRQPQHFTTATSKYVNILLIIRRFTL